MALAFGTSVTNFVKTADLNGAALPAWPRFDLMNFTLDDGLVFGPEPRPGVTLVERATGAGPIRRSTP